MLLTIGDYEYNPSDVLGTGAFGIVYRGQRKGTPTDVVAIKVIKKKPSMEQAMKREMEIQKKLSELKNENILTLLDYQDNLRNMILVTEFCNKGDLSSYLQSIGGVLDEHTISVFLYQIAQAMVTFHSLNYVHRDLKPQNILLSLNAAAMTSESDPFNITLKIADLGLARCLPEGDLANTVCGSPLYMAPEVVDGVRYDFKADLWSIGVILLQCFVGLTPIVDAHKKRLSYSSQISGHMSIEIKDLISRLLQPSQTERIDCDDFMKHAAVNRMASYYELKKCSKARELDYRAKMSALQKQLQQTEKAQNDLALRLRLAEKEKSEMQQKHVKEVEDVKTELNATVHKLQTIAKQSEEKVERISSEYQQKLQLVSDELARMKSEQTVRESNAKVLRSRISAQECQLIIGIEIGPVWTSCAFSSKQEFRSDPLNVSVCATWESGVAPGSTIVDFRVPTAIILDDNCRYVAYGHAAKELATSSLGDNQHLCQHFPKYLLASQVQTSSVKQRKRT